jgi:hypothetical protein
VTEYLCLGHTARLLTGDELDTARSEQTAVCSATSSCTELVTYAVCWRYTDRPGGQEWMGAALVCTGHADAFADHHGIDLADEGVAATQTSHRLGGDS